jgi:hypothetical protein
MQETMHSIEVQELLEFLLAVRARSLTVKARSTVRKSGVAFVERAG